MASSLKLRVRHRRGRSSTQQVVQGASLGTPEMPQTPPCLNVLKSCVLGNGNENIELVNEIQSPSLFRFVEIFFFAIILCILFSFFFLVCNSYWKSCLFSYPFCCRFSAWFVLVLAAKPFTRWSSHGSQPGMDSKGTVGGPVINKLGFISS